MPQSVTVYCPYCCPLPPATCKDCQFEDGNDPSCGPGQQFEIRTYGVGSQCGDRTFKEVTTCYQCFDCDFTDWYPNESEVCRDVRYTKYRDPGEFADPRCVRESQNAVGAKQCNTCEICGYPEFVSDGCQEGFQGERIVFNFGDFCNGIPIMQEGECLDCYPCDFGEPEGPDPSEVCEGVEYFRKLVPGETADSRCVEQYELAYGENPDLCGVCEACGYSGDPSVLNCDPESQQQVSILLEAGRDCGSVVVAVPTECNTCIFCPIAEWTPSPDSVCEGETFTQNAIFGTSADPSCAPVTRERVGTRPCQGERGYQVIGISTEVIGSPACTTTPNLDKVTDCYINSELENVARDSIYGDFVVDCSNEPPSPGYPTGFCNETGAPGSYPWTDAVYENTLIIQESPVFIAEVTFTFEDCSIDPPDLRITAEIRDCYKAEEGPDPGIIP